MPVVRLSDKKPLLHIVVIDFDDTIASNSGHPDYKIQDPIKGAWDTLNSLSDLGLEIVIWTSRAWTEYDIIKDWLDYHGFDYDRLICGQPLGDYYINDKNLDINKGWKDIINQIK